MATPLYLISTVLMGVLVVGVAVSVRRGRTWQSYTPQRDTADVTGDTADVTANTAGSDRSLPFVLVFVVLIGGTLGTTLFVLGGGTTAVVFGSAAVLVLAFLVAGVYATARSNGHPRSHAVGEAFVALGALVLGGVVGWLLTTAGA
jgi:amino acid permease